MTVLSRVAAGVGNRTSRCRIVRTERTGGLLGTPRREAHVPELWKAASLAKSAVLGRANLH